MEAELLRRPPIWGSMKNTIFLNLEIRFGLSSLTKIGLSGVAFLVLVGVLKVPSIEFQESQNFWCLLEGKVILWTQIEDK